MLPSTLLFLTLPLASPAWDDVYVSLPDLREVRKLDTDTGTLEPWARGLGVPFYGEFAPDGNLYLPDSTLGLVWRIRPDGTPEVLSSGGLIGRPLSVAVHPVTSDLYVTDAGNQWVVIVDPTDGSQRMFSDNSHGLYTIPGGVAFGSDGTLYMTDHGGFQIWAIDPTGTPTMLVDGKQHGMQVPAGIEADHAGNLFVANYVSNTVVRIVIETGEVEPFSNSALLQWPNDVEFAPGGGLYVANDAGSRMVHIDALGNTTTVHEDPSVGGWLGLALPGGVPGCDGWMQPYGQGTAGAAGFVPRLRGLFNPCPGAEVGYVLDRGAGGARGLLLWGLGQASFPAFGGQLLIDLTGLWGRVPFALGGSGAGQGRKVWRFVHPDDPALSGLDVFLQAAVFDAANSYGIALSDGLQVHFGTDPF